MGGGVTLYRRRSLAGCKPGISPACEHTFKSRYHTVNMPNSYPIAHPGGWDWMAFERGTIRFLQLTPGWHMHKFLLLNLRLTKMQDFWWEYALNKDLIFSHRNGNIPKLSYNNNSVDKINVLYNLPRGCQDALNAINSLIKVMPVSWPSVSKLFNGNTINYLTEYRIKLLDLVSWC